MSTGLGKLEGVNKVEVSLEKGLAKIELKPENKITLSKIETIVKKNGFSPKSAQLKLNGKVKSKQITVTKSDESIPAILPADNSPDPHTEYLIQGNLVIDEDNDSHSITVSSLTAK